jgi:DNA-binding response OmpR family regulator
MAKAAVKAKQRVLIIEDEPALRDIYGTKMRMEGFEVSEAADGLEGFDKAMQEGADVVLLDIMMPVKDGFETLHDLKANPKTKPIPVVLLSNLGQDFEVRRGLELGAECFLTKANLTPGTVAERVHQIVDRAKPHRP